MSNNQLISEVTASQIEPNIPEFKTGDTVKVHLKIIEGNKERIQIFEGFVLKRSKKGINATFTVRKESFGVGVEKTFFINSPTIAKIEVVKLGKVRQSRIFYMRKRKGKTARIKPKNTNQQKESKKNNSQLPSTTSETKNDSSNTENI